MEIKLIPENVKKQFEYAEHEEFVWRMAKKCIDSIQAAGSFGCSDPEIIENVANAMIESTKGR